MALKDFTPVLLDHIKQNKQYIEHNYILNDIYNGNLLPYLLRDLENSLSKSYFNDIKDRMVPLNILTKLVEKLSKSYMTAPSRNPVEENTLDEDLIRFYEDKTSLNKQMNLAENYSFLFKGYALEPFIDGGNVGIRPIPFDRFLVLSTNTVNPMDVTVFIKFIGKRTVGQTSKEIYYAYTNDEFYAFDEDGNVFLEALEHNDGINPFGTIPFFYGNRGQQLLPTQETDLLAMTKTIPKMLSDLSGSILYNSFPLTYTVDVDHGVDGLVRSPNGMWDLKSDINGDKQPQVNTITPSTDIENTLDFIAKSLSAWLEFKGIKAGNIGSSSEASVSGISKIMDIVDTLEIRKISQLEMASDEKSTWQIIKAMHNYWVDSGELDDVGKFSDNFKLSITFDEPKPLVSREQQLKEIKMEVDEGYLPKRNAIEILYPDLTVKQVDERIATLNFESQVFNITSQGDSSSADK